MTRDVCRPIFDADGNVIARARMAEDASDDAVAAMAQLVQAVQKHQAQIDAADPEAAAERARRQAEALARIRAKVAARLRGGQS